MSKATLKKKELTRVAYGKGDLRVGEIIFHRFARWCIWANYTWKLIMPFESDLLVYFCNTLQILGILSVIIVSCLFHLAVCIFLILYAF